jgi:hypothetical protein
MSILSWNKARLHATAAQSTSSIVDWNRAKTQKGADADRASRLSVCPEDCHVKEINLTTAKATIQSMKRDFKTRSEIDSRVCARVRPSSEAAKLPLMFAMELFELEAHISNRPQQATRTSLKVSTSGVTLARLVEARNLSRISSNGGRDAERRLTLHRWSTCRQHDRGRRPAARMSTCRLVPFVCFGEGA